MNTTPLRCALLACLMLGLGCSNSHPAYNLDKASGDGQVGIAGQALAQPLSVKTTDRDGNPVGGVKVIFEVLDGGGSIESGLVMSSDDGKASAIATLGPSAMKNRYRVSANGLFGSPIIFEASRAAFKLQYSDPTAGKLRLVRNPTSNDSTVVLDLVVAPGVTVTGYSAGYNLPMDTTKVQLDAMPMVSGSALDPGSDPKAALAVIPKQGPLSGMLTTAQSQKASGKGAVPSDTSLTENTLLYSIRLNMLPTAALGIVFDGTAADFVVPSGGMRDRIGTTVVSPKEIGFGKLEVVR